MSNASQTIFVFPGQGSQHPGMAAEFMFATETKELFEQANDALGFDLAALMKDGDEAELQKTENAQPALFLAGYAAFAFLSQQFKKTLPEMAAYVAGHSLGEYTALSAADVFDLESGLKLVRKRGEAMRDAVPANEGAMAAVIGIPLNQVESYCNTLGCFLANDNSELQAVISGPQAAVDEASNMAAMERAKKICRLDVSGPFHSPMMYPAAEPLQDALNEIEFKKPNVPAILNVTAEADDDADYIKALLVQQLTQTVRWRESMQYAAERGITQVVELGSGKVLTGLARRCDDRLIGMSLTSPWEIDEYIVEVENGGSAASPSAETA